MARQIDRPPNEPAALQVIPNAASGVCLYSSCLRAASCSRSRWPVACANALCTSGYVTAPPQGQDSALRSRPFWVLASPTDFNDARLSRTCPECDSCCHSDPWLRMGSAPSTQNFTRCMGSGAILAYGDTSCSHAHAASHLNLFFFCMQAAQQDGAPLLHTRSMSGLAMASSDSPGGVNGSSSSSSSPLGPRRARQRMVLRENLLVHEAGVQTLPALSRRSRELGSSRGMGRLHLP